MKNFNDKKADLAFKKDLLDMAKICYRKHWRKKALERQGYFRGQSYEELSLAKDFLELAKKTQERIDRDNYYMPLWLSKQLSTVLEN